MCSKMKSPSDFDSIVDLIIYFKDEITCLKHLEYWVWGGDIRCQQCGSDNICRFEDQKRFKCRNCETQFTAKVGTIFQGSKLPMVKWFTAIYLIGSHKKGISTHQLARDLKVTQKTSWFMLHRIRKAMQGNFDSKMDGIIMSDETFVGGKNKNRHIDKKFVNAQGRSFKDKVPVLGLMKEGGEIRCFVMADTKMEDIHPHLFNNIKEGSILVSDEWKGYNRLADIFNHQIVRHNRHKFTSDEGYSTNAVEGFWSGLKKSIIGIYHKVSTKHLQKYCDELAFRFNTRTLGQGERLALLMSKVNCRLPYKQLIR